LAGVVVPQAVEAHEVGSRFGKLPRLVREPDVDIFASLGDRFESADRFEFADNGLELRRRYRELDGKQPAAARFGLRAKILEISTVGSDDLAQQSDVAVKARRAFPKLCRTGHVASCDVERCMVLGTRHKSKHAARSRFNRTKARGS